MSDNNATVTATAAAIEAAFGGRWGVWLSDSGWWWAARRQALTAVQLSAGAVPYLHADSPHELTDRIHAQEQLLSGTTEGTRPADMSVPDTAVTTALESLTASATASARQAGG